MAAGLGPCKEESYHWRRRSLDLESGRSTLPRCHPDRGPVSCRQHLWDLSARLFAGDDAGRKRWTARSLEQLDQGRIEALVKTLRELPPPTAELAKLALNEAEYFERNAERMRYPSFRAQSLFVGSGVIEAGCKTVIGNRLKRSGMLWTVRGANAIIALRCTRLSGRLEDYWESRVPPDFHRFVAHPATTS